MSGRGRGRGRGPGRPPGSGRGGKINSNTVVRDALTGKRSGVVVDIEAARADDHRDADGLLDEDRFFEAARLPGRGRSPSRSASREAEALSASSFRQKPKGRIRFSLDVEGGASTSSASDSSPERDVQRHPKQQQRGAPSASALRGASGRLLFSSSAAAAAAAGTSTPASRASSVSPSALSRASTAPPDPAADDTEDDEEEDVEEDEEPTEVALAQRKKRDGGTPRVADRSDSIRREGRKDETDRDDGDDRSPALPDDDDDDVAPGGDVDPNDPPGGDEPNDEEDADDLAPPPPPPDDSDQSADRASPEAELDLDATPEAEAETVGVGETDGADETEFPLPDDGADDDGDDGDKEGPGYHMVDGQGEDSGEEQERPAASAATKATHPDAADSESEGDDRYAASKPVAKKGPKKTRAGRSDDGSASSEESDPGSRPPKKRSKKASNDSYEERDAKKKESKGDRASNKKKKKKRMEKKQSSNSSSDESDSQRPPPKKRNEKKAKVARKTAFTPKGIPLPRTYSAVPVSDLKDTPDGTLRRSQRARIRPLEFWRSETVVWGPNDEFKSDPYLANMPVPKAVRYADPTPYKPRAPHKTAQKKKDSRRKETAAKKKTKRDDRGGNSDEDGENGGPHRHDTGTELPPFDLSKLHRKRNIMEGDQAHVWDDTEQQTAELKVVSYQEDLKPRTLPKTHPRLAGESELVGSAAQAFNVSNDNEHYPGYLMGSLVLPPRAIKDPEAVGNCAQTFTVVQCQPQSLEVSYGHPDTEEGIVDPATAQSFFLGPGDMFRVPPGNCYRLENHSRKADCHLTWTILRTIPYS